MTETATATETRADATATAARIEDLLRQLTLAEKCAMVSGRDLWTVPGCARLGIPDWVVSDGPAGVRGRLLGPGLVVPGPSALAATWDPPLVEQVGRALGEECLDKDVDVLLAPTVNLHRAPRGGRHFECFSEDPTLSAAMAVAYIRGVQSTGVGACVKHLVANDQETDRFEIDVQVDERTLREIYLPPFEAAVRDADVRVVMGAYNYVNGHHACAHPDLLVTLLRDEWGFDGVVLSDWNAIKDTVTPAVNGLDVEMPGPGRWWGGGRLQAAVERGEVAEDDLDDKVRHVLQLLSWRDRRQGVSRTSEEPREHPEHRVLARSAAAAGMVLIHNRAGLLPLDPGRHVAVIGAGAGSTSIMGGGSASLEPHRHRSVLPALIERLGAGAVTAAPGVRLQRRPAGLTMASVAGSELTVEVFAGTECGGDPSRSFTTTTSYNLWPRGSEAWPEDLGEVAVRVRAVVRPTAPGPHQVMAAGIGRAVLRIDGDVVADNAHDPIPAGLALRGGLATVELEDREYVLELEHTAARELPVVVLDIGFEPAPLDTADHLLDDAARAAADADIAIVVVGTSAEWETEGSDRADLSLPAGQDELVRRVVAANPRTVVVLNCGAPTSLPWLADVGAVLLAWYPGQEAGDAIADVLLGEVDPGGRMPTTWPRAERDTPAFGNFPGEAGTVRYGEGNFVGYRWYDARAIEALVPFGHGGSYTTFEWDPPTVEGQGTDLTVAVTICNVGPRRGSEVVQVYVAPVDAPVPRPPKELAGFAKVDLAPGTSATARIDLDDRSFARWDPATHGWTVDPGAFRILVAASAVDIRGELEVPIVPIVPILPIS